MPLSKPSSSAPGFALMYITLGAIMTIWSAVWFVAYRPESRAMIAVDAGLFLTGLAFLIIGFGVGRIGREARHADLPPEGAAPDVTNRAGVR